MLVGLSRQWVEIGAGGGTWARALRAAGADVRAFDIEPRGEGVEIGSHIDAASVPGPLLIVWPPDGAFFNEWITATDRPLVAVCKDFGRGDVGPWADGYELSANMRLPIGRKGFSSLRVWQAPPRPIP